VHDLNKAPPSAPRHPIELDWFAAARRSLQEVNARLIELLASAAENPVECLPLATQFRDLIEPMDPAARARVTSCPYLLVDAGFQDPMRWSRAAAQTEAVGATTPCFPRAQAIELAHMTLLLAWTLVHVNRTGAGLLLGVSPACAEIIANLKLQEMQRIATDYCGWARPRWENRPEVWRRLLSAANSADARALNELGLQGLRLFFGELLP